MISFGRLVSLIWADLLPALRTEYEWIISAEKLGTMAGLDVCADQFAILLTVNVAAGWIETQSFLGNVDGANVTVQRFLERFRHTSWVTELLEILGKNDAPHGAVCCTTELEFDEASHDHAPHCFVRRQNEVEWVVFSRDCFLKISRGISCSGHAMQCFVKFMLVLPTQSLVHGLLRIDPEGIDLMADENNVVEDILALGSSIRVIEEVRKRQLESDELHQFCKVDGFAVALSSQVLSETLHGVCPKVSPVAVAVAFHLTGCSHFLGGIVAEEPGVHNGEGIADTEYVYEARFA